MTGEEKKPPPFFCPACGQKHRADLSALIGVENAVMKTSCAGCSIALAVRVDEDGLPHCKKLEEHTGVEDKPEAPKKSAPTPTKRKGKKGGAPVASKRRGKSGKKGGAPVASKRKGKDRKKDKETEKAEPEAPAASETPDTPDTPDAPDAGADAPAPAGDAPKSAASREREESREKDVGSTTEPIIAEFDKGDHVGRYQVESVLGQGGTSTVYAAFDPTTNRTVALKVFDKDQSDTMQQRFMREIEVQANIRHQNIMPVFDRGELDDGRPYFTMELLYKPWTLTKIIEHRERGTLGRYATLKELQELPVLIEKVLIPVCDGIYVANVENGVIHRDLKPDNVLIDSRTLRPYVIDFGICQAIETKSKLDTGPVIATVAEDAGIVGTPRYLSPEQAKGSVNSRTDVWGLGGLLFVVLSGEPPIAGAVPITRAELKRRIQALEEAKAAAVSEGNDKRIELCDEKLGRLQDPGLRTIEEIFRDAREGTYTDLPKEAPAQILAIVKKAMAKTQSDRYVNARQLSAEISTWIKGGTVRAMSSAGGAGAAMHSARRAIKANLMAAVCILAAVGVGLFIGKTLAGTQEVGASTRTEDALADIKSLEESLVALGPQVPSLTPVERHRIWHLLDERGAGIASRLSAEPDTNELDAALRRLRYVRGRMAPPRFVIDVPAGTKVHGRNLVTNSDIALKAGENQVPPGRYLVSVGDQASIRFPVDVPFVVRAVGEKPDVEAAHATFKLPVAPGDVPAGMVLILGGTVTPRGLPFAEPSSSLAVAPFLMDRAEVTNEQYGEFLMTLPEEERTTRTPSVAFVPNPETGKAELVKGKESLPVVGIRPEDAAAYAAWRSKRDGVPVRLPKEEEWVLAAGGNVGFALINGARGLRTDGEFAPPLKAAGTHQADESPYGVRGLLANAREIVLPAFDGGPAFVVKGAGVGDAPDQGATYAFHAMAKDARHATTGFRCVRELP